MLWVTFAGSDYDWISWQSGLFLAAFVVAAGIAVLIEFKHSEPIVPIRVLRNSTTALMIIAGMAVGVSMFGTGTFLTQYFQLAGGNSPTKAGLMTIPMILSQLLSSVIGGQIVSRTGRWKPLMVIGSILLVGGMAGLGFLDHATPYWQIAIWMAVAGIGIGMLIQNIVLAVQNTVDVKDIGASSATIAFFRSLGGAVGVSVLGAVLADKVQTKITDGIMALGPKAAKALSGSSGGFDLDINDLPGPVRTIVHHAYGDTFGTIFLIAAIVAIAAFLAVVVVREVPLRNTVALQKPSEQADAAAPATQAEAGTEEAVAGTDYAAIRQSADRPAQADPVINRPVPVATTNGRTSETAGAAVPTPASAPAEVSEPAWDDRDLDDPAERLSVAALDVLTAAQDRVRAQEAVGRETIDRLVARLDVVSHEVDSVIGSFHRQIQELRAELEASTPVATPAPDGVGGTDLRQYEYNLLLDSQQTADRVTRLARAEAERTLAEAEQQRSELERRIEQLRGVERDLTATVSDRLRADQTESANEGSARD
jgi:hypothetical protein